LITYAKNGSMRDEGVRSMVAALRQLLQTASHFRPEKIYCFATAPFRAIADTESLAAIVRNATGLEVETLSGEEEARLGLIGAQYQTGAADGLFVDLGGGSMEASLLKNGRVLHAQSIPVGCVNLSNRFVSGLLPKDKELKKIKHYADEGLFAFSWLSEARGLDMYCMGGTARALGQMHKALRGSALPIEAYAMDAKELKHVYQDVIELQTEGIRLMSRICPGRIYTLVPGAVLLWRLAKAAEVKEARLSTYGVREGYLIQRILNAGGAAPRACGSEGMPVRRRRCPA
jgi:Exopolyphosphatase